MNKKGLLAGLSEEQLQAISGGCGTTKEEKTDNKDDRGPITQPF